MSSCTAISQSRSTIIAQCAVRSAKSLRPRLGGRVRCDASYKELQAVAEEAARAGAAVVQEALDKPRNISSKSTSTDLVTETDVASEAAILAVLRKHFPSHAILGEEGGVTGDTDSEYLWCVDPLDGTTNFAHGYPWRAASTRRR